MKTRHQVDYSEKILEVKNLRQYFTSGTGKRKIQVKAVDGISFDVYKREVFGLVGESGCGKTTTGRTIMKLYRPTDGQIIYKGNIIGAGYEGFIYKAKKIRREARQEIIINQPYKRKKQLLKEQYKFDILDIKKRQFKETETFQIQSEETKQIKRDYNLKTKTIKEQYLLEKRDLIHDYNLKKGAILSEGLTPIIKEMNHFLKIVKSRFKDKVKFIKSLKFSKLDEDQQIRYLHDEMANDLNKVKQNAAAKLKKFDLDFRDYDFKDKVRKIIREEARINKSRIADKKAVLKEKLAEAKAKYLQEKETHRENKYNVLEYHRKLNEIKSEHRRCAASFSGERKAAKSNYKEKLNELKLDKKENPEKYLPNSEKILEIKRERNLKVAEQRNNIQIAKKQNKLKEFPDHKEERLAKIRNLKAEYQEKREALEKEFNGNKKEFKDKLDNLKAKYDEDYAEIQKTKPNFTNYVSSIQMIFQDPVSSLNPRMVVSEIISEGLIVRGEKNHAKNREKVYEVLRLVGLDKDHATRYPHEFSGGQRQRIGVARSIIVRPDFIIADEPISALDVSIQAQVINLLNDLKEKLGLTILFIAHDLSVVKYFSDRIAVMYMGKIVELTSSEELFKNPLHPYTKSLLSAIPYPDPNSERKRKRFLYNPRVHDYSVDKPTMREIKKDHFIYANDKEFAEYQKELAQKG